MPVSRETLSDLGFPRDGEYRPLAQTPVVSTFCVCETHPDHSFSGTVRISTMAHFHLREGLLPDGWARGVAVTVNEAGGIVAVEPDSPPAAGATPLGVTVPGVANVHSHAFQRGMAGLAERSGPGDDSFWSWREAMYAFTERLGPDELLAVAALLQCEMLECGFTTLGEFHYLHHDPRGRPYADPARMSAALVEAAKRTGMALTLLPVLYRHAGFDGRPAEKGQRRFVTDLPAFAALVEAAGRHLRTLPHGRLGIAPHSLRAVSVPEIRDVLPLAEGGPVHIHVAEQEREVEECLDHLGTTPVAHLLETLPVDERWCLIHATHAGPAELAQVARQGAVVGLCPVTEANLGDGIFPAAAFLELGGHFGVGSDSNIRVDLAEELRTLEYGQRLSRRERNLLSAPGESTGRALLEEAARSGAQALDQPTGALAVGRRADFVVLDDDAPLLAGRQGDAILDAWVFGGDGRVVTEAWVGGRRVVRDGRALARERAENDYRTALARMKP